MKKLYALNAVITGFVIMLTFLAPNMALAQSFDNSKNAVCSGIEEAGSDTCSASSSTLDKVIKAALEILSITVGIAAVVMMIIGGLRYITSGGEAAAITSAKNTILYALIGIAIVALSQITIHFVLNKVNQPPVVPPTNNANPNVI